MACTGKTSVTIRDKKAAERKYFMGGHKNPILICKRKEVAGLFTEEFWQYFKVWEYFHYGFGLPGGLPWDQQDPQLMEVILNMEKYFQAEFSSNTNIMKYLESIIKHQKAQMGVKV